MRIVFVGAVRFSRHCLAEVLRHGGEVAAVLTLAPDDAGFHADYADLNEIARPGGIPVHHIDNINAPETVELLRRLAPDVIFAFGWSQIIDTQVLAIPRLGCIGTHPTLLPRNRGRHPLIWALVQGLAESGLTFFFMDRGADSGDILWQRPFPITQDDDAGSLYGKVEALATVAIGEFLPELQRGTAPRIPQDHSAANYWRKRSPRDGWIDWAAPTAKTHNLIRALTRPYAGASTFMSGVEVVVWRAHIPEQPLLTAQRANPPGTIIRRTRSQIDVRTGDGHLSLLEIEPRGSAEIKVSQRFESARECVS